MNVLVSQFQHFYYLYNGKKIETGLGERVKLHECQHFVCVCLCVCVCVCVCVFNQYSVSRHVVLFWV